MIKGIPGERNSQIIRDIMSAKMLQQAGQAATLDQRQQIKDQFLAIFYKELLKQAFKPPKLGPAENENSFSGAFGNDLLVEQLALQLAQSKSFSADQLFPSVNETGTLLE